MNQKNLKKDLTKVVILTIVILGALVVLTIWDNKTDILNQIAVKYF